MTLIVRMTAASEEDLLLSKEVLIDPIHMGQIGE